MLRCFRSGSLTLPLLVYSLCGQAEVRQPAGSAGVYGDTIHHVHRSLEQLGAWGFVPTQILGIRPWTRGECLRQAAEARGIIKERQSTLGADVTAQALGLVAFIEESLEVQGPKANIRVTSLYVRQGLISGAPLTDGYHLGQTWIGDLGRPFGRGRNGIAGGTVEASWGRMFATYRGEHQSAPAAPVYSDPVYRVFAHYDGSPASKPSHDDLSRFRSLEAYVGGVFGNLVVSAGKQTMWWGPGFDQPLSFSRNAEPVWSGRIANLSPFRLPGFGSKLGSIRVEATFGRLGGHTRPQGPWFNAQKVSFKLTPELEMGFTRWSMFLGQGHPATPRVLWRNFSSFTSSAPVGPIDANDPGDRKAGFDFRYRLFGPAKSVFLYSDSYAEDDPSPLAAPRRAALSPGIHFTRLPGLPKTDLRVEVASSAPLGAHNGPFMFHNNQYPGGNTNHGVLIGSWTGRQGRAIQGWLTYFSEGTRRFEVGYRHFKGEGTYLPGGATNNKVSARSSFPLRRDASIDVFLQLERFAIPVIGSPQRNVSGWITFLWEPKMCLIGC